MSHKRNEALRHVQHSMHHVIAAGEGKFRTCLYAHCPYKKQKETIKDDGQLSLFGESEKRTIKWNKRYALSDMILHKYRELYGNKVTKEDIFFYIYAVLQTPLFC